MALPISTMSLYFACLFHPFFYGIVKIQRNTYSRRFLATVMVLSVSAVGKRPYFCSDRPNRNIRYSRSLFHEFEMVNDHVIRLKVQGSSKGQKNGINNEV